MSKFEVGDKVRMIDMIPTPAVEVLELGTCGDADCRFGGETFRFTDPGGQGDDWMHVEEFERAE